jgi:ABC-type Fe3+-hydroxamate transport system substrate-binding protein
MLLKIRDDMDREVVFGQAPKRVVSLVPSDTFTVAALGCGGALVGRTDFCELPADVVAKTPSVGGTKNPRVDAICDLSPDLVIANQEENSKGDLEKLAERRVPIYVCFPQRVADGIAHLAKLARIFRVEGDPAVKSLVKAGYEAVREAEAARGHVRAVPTFCPIWMDPLMTIHATTFISDMLALAGAENVFGDRERKYPLAADLGRAAPLDPARTVGRDVRYPRVAMQEVIDRAPELVLLPDEPHPFTEKDAEVFRAQPIPAAAKGAVARTSGKDLCWYGAQSVAGLPRVRALVDGYRRGGGV